MKRIRGSGKIMRYPAMWFAALLVLGLMVTSTPVYAGSCASDYSAICPIELPNTNVTGVSITIIVTIDNSGPTTNLSVQWDSDNLTNTPLGIDMFFYNDDALVTGITGNAVGWMFNFGGTQADGFGDFASHRNNGGAETGGIAAPLVFSLDQLVTEFPENGQGAEFAAHIRYSNGCSAFVSDGTADTSPNRGCNTTTVPEPSSSLLLGLSLVGIAVASLWGKKLMRSKA